MSLLQTCFNCGRRGVLQNQMVCDEKRNIFCSSDCGSTFAELPYEEQVTRQLTPRKLSERKAAFDESQIFYQDLANLDRSDYFLLKLMRKNENYIAAMNKLEYMTPAEGNKNSSEDSHQDQEKSIKTPSLNSEGVQEHFSKTTVFSIFHD